MIDPRPATVDDVFRASAAPVTAALIRYCGDFDLAEEAVQEAFTVAVDRWRRDGVPHNPAGWITTTARRRLIDRLRRDKRRADKYQLLARIEAMPVDAMNSEDELLRLVFTCCHPALSLDVRVALTLRTVCQLSTGEIAAAFVVPESTMAQRLVRGKRKIRVAGIPYEVPSPEELGNRVSAVLAVLYLVFNAGYNAIDDPDRGAARLVDEAIRLARSVDLLMPGQPEVMGLLALMLLHDARTAARRSAGGEIVLLDEQDRAAWDQAQIDEALDLIAAAPRLGSVGQYWLQAAIAGKHLATADPAGKDWAGIVELYDRLLDQTEGSAVVRLNRAVALAEARGPAAGLDALEPVGERLAGYSYYHAARAELLQRVGDADSACGAYRRAISLATSEAQRLSLTTALEELERSA